jgi:hypothetical protein
MTITAIATSISSIPPVVWVLYHARLLTDDLGGKVDERNMDVYRSRPRHTATPSSDSEREANRAVTTNSATDTRARLLIGVDSDPPPLRRHGSARNTERRMPEIPGYFLG